jgi:hypothetical protein
MWHKFRFAALGTVLAVLPVLAVVGCSRQRDVPAVATPTKEAVDHTHDPGAHGGEVIDLGGGSYHVEAVFEKGGVIRLYTLGKDETRVQEVQTQTLTAYVKPAGGGEAVPVALRPEPQEGDTPGKTSRFTGTLPEALHGRAVEVTVPSLRIGDERFRLAFKSPAPGHGMSELPAKVAGEAERQLYLTPAGRYTAADIRANGGVTASQKYDGVMAEHDLKPQPGDKVCPITLTKANPKFTWVVGGAAYEFCCPPCIDEFVKAAKETPDEIKAPGEYVKK